MYGLLSYSLMLTTVGEAHANEQRVSAQDVTGEVISQSECRVRACRQRGWVNLYMGG